MKYIFVVFILFSISGYGQNIDLVKLENHISENNRAGKHKDSQNELLQLLSENNISDLEKAKVTLLLATTFRSINDYSSAINYLNKAKTLSESAPGGDSLKMNIDAEMAFTYFDDQKYDLSDKIINEIKKKKYVNLHIVDKAYIIMQEGYINYLKKNYSEADLEYERSVQLLKANSFCNQPVVMVKQMQLYGATKQFAKADQIYNSTMSIADSCKILKYKIYATEEIKKLYEDHNNEQKVYEYSRILDSLKRIDDRENNLSEMHVANQNFLEKENETEKESSFLFSIIAVVLFILIIFLASYFYKKSKNYKTEKTKFEEEISKIKEELKVFSTIQFSNTKKENEVLNSEKLNKRQKELLLLVSEGKTNKDIATELSITEATVKYHLGNIYSILDIKNRKEILRKNL